MCIRDSCSTDTHPTADWIYEQARKRIPEISLGTVYRNLQVLLEDKKIIAVSYTHLDVYKRQNQPCLCLWWH